MSDDEVKKRPRSRARKRLSVPVSEPIPEPQAPPSPHTHPVFWVQCFGCGQETPQIIGSDGRAHLPKGWVTIFPTDRTSRVESPDVYASEDCAHDAAMRVRLGIQSDNVTILRQPTFSTIDVTFREEP